MFGRGLALQGTGAETEPRRRGFDRRLAFDGTSRTHVTATNPPPVRELATMAFLPFARATRTRHRVSTTALLRPLGTWIAELDYADVPADSLRAARYQLLNSVAALHSAAHVPEASAIGRAAQRFGARGKSTVLASGVKCSPTEAAMVNAAYSMAQDFDDIIWMGHTGHSAVFAPLAVAEHEGASTKQLLLACVVANEVAGRLGASSFLGPLNGQM